MKVSIWTYLIISLGVLITVIILFVQNVTTTNEEEFYLLREILESSMVDAIDYGTYRTSGKLVISKEKFEEVFIRRFAESVTNNKEYTIDFYDIYEYPPKATVKVTTDSGEYSIGSDLTDININSVLSGILETKDYECVTEVYEEDAQVSTIDVIKFK